MTAAGAGLFSLEGRVAVVTGGASGIGRTTALRLAAAGAHVVVGDLADAGEVAERCGGIAVRVDVSREDEVAALLGAAVEAHGRLDVVVNNAGIGTTEPVTELDDAGLQRNLDVNYKGAAWGTKHAALLMGPGGSIVNTASYAGRFGYPLYTAYAASKAAIVALTQTAALELGGRGIRVNCVCPGTIDTPMNEGEDTALEMAVADVIHPLGRIGTPEEVAAVIHFLASDGAGYVTGQAIGVDGGLSAGLSLELMQALAERGAAAA